MTWKAPSQPDTPITGYQVINYEYQSNDSTTSDTLDDDTSSYSIDSLSKDIYVRTYVYSKNLCLHS